MKILDKSYIKDYYDYVAHQYGGGDPKLVWTRGHYSECSFELPSGLNYNQLPSSSIYGKDEIEFEFRYCFVAGKLYLLWAQYSAGSFGNFKILTTSDLATNEQLFKRLKHWSISNTDTDKYRQKIVDSYVNIQAKPGYLYVAKQIKQPVFIVTACDRSSMFKHIITTTGHYHTLKDLGFPSIISPEQMYQDLAYFYGLLCEPEPIKEVADKYKIQQHGFDKHSFRNSNNG